MNISIEMTTPNARLLARALRCLDSEPSDETLNALSEFGHDIGAILGITSDSDDSDEIDEFPSGQFFATVAGELVTVDFGE